MYKYKLLRWKSFPMAFVLSYGIYRTTIIGSTWSGGWTSLHHLACALSALHRCLVLVSLTQHHHVFIPYLSRGSRLLLDYMARRNMLDNTNLGSVLDIIWGELSSVCGDIRWAAVYGVDSTVLFIFSSNARNPSASVRYSCLAACPALCLIRALQGNLYWPVWMYLC